MTMKSKIGKVASRLRWPRKGGPKTLYCSFCGKSQHHVEKLIAGPSVYICNECVAICRDIIETDGVHPIEEPRTQSDEGSRATESKDSPGAEPHMMADIQSMPTERLLGWLKFQEDLFEQARAGMQDAVDTLRKREVSWAAIGEALRVSRQAAWDRFS